MIRQIRQAVVMTAIVLLLIGFGGLTPQPAQAAVTQIKDPSGQILYRSYHRLRDELGKAWQVIVFKQMTPQNGANQLYLRLMGLPGSAEVVHPKALKIRTQEDQIFQADDSFISEAPIATMGEYNVQAIVPKLPIEEVLLGIPLGGEDYLKLWVPRSVVQEWHEVLDKTS